MSKWDFPILRKLFSEHFFLSWEKLSEEDVEILKQIYRDAVDLNSKIFKLQGHFPLGNTYFLVLDNLLGAIRGLSDPESIKRNPTYIKEKINGAKYYLERLIKESTESVHSEV